MFKMEDPEFLAQAGHTLLGILGVVWPFALFHTITSSVVGTLAVGSYFAVKETVVDPKVEGEPFFWEGVKDCAFGSIGLSLGWISLFFIGI